MVGNGKKKSAVKRAVDLARAGGGQEIDPGMYIVQQGGVEVGQVAVISTGTTTTLEHWFLYTESASDPTRSAYTMPGQESTVSMTFHPNGSDPGGSFDVSTFRRGLE